MSALSTSNDLLRRNNDSPPISNDTRDNGSSISDPQTAGGNSHTDGQTAVTEDTTWSRQLGSNTPLKRSISSANQSTLMNFNQKSTHNETQGPAPENVESMAMDTAPFAMELDSALPLKQTPKPQKKAEKKPGVDFNMIHNHPEFRARSSIPSRLSWVEFGRQGIVAAHSSRLNPFALHPNEYALLRPHITKKQVTIYLNIRNAILRLWHRNPLVPVSRQEAAGCAKDVRHFALSQVAYEWLLRNGYINFGCVEVSKQPWNSTTAKPNHLKQKTVVVIGAGVSGLGCARQLEALGIQLEDKFAAMGQRRPRVVVLEGRPRIGGRVYSHPLMGNGKSTLPAGTRSTAEMGAQIITGFENGNPLNFIVRGQLAIPCHVLRDNSVLYDYDGAPVNEEQDQRVQRLWNDILERVSVFRYKLPTAQTEEGDADLIALGEDPKESAADSDPYLSALDETGVTVNDRNPMLANIEKSQNTAAGVEKLAGRQYPHARASENLSGAQAALQMGWPLKPGIVESHTVDLSSITSNNTTLGATMDEGIRQYQDIVELTEQDLRLLNWHHANLEYANAASVNDLSLGGWDLDIGNEFEGEHTEVIGGYTQLPRGLWKLPSQLDVRLRAAVERIKSPAPSSKGKTVIIECRNGERFEADEVVVTVPLGVLKAKSIKFQPPLPDWKLDCIERMGFGLLNKVVLVFDHCFWEQDRDIFGLLNRPDGGSLNQHDYANGRGQFYLFWNCLKTSGLPTLVALMAGASAHLVEVTDNDAIVSEVTSRLATIFAHRTVPHPREVVITRWRRDPFARGSYSFVAPVMLPDDYDTMARACGAVHFAGEATCGTHPATVHGAYISGLRAAAEVTDALLGPQAVPGDAGCPLVPPRAAAAGAPAQRKRKRAGGYIDVWEPVDGPAVAGGAAVVGIVGGSAVEERERRAAEREGRLQAAIVAALGPRPTGPPRGRLNPYILYVSEHWDRCRAECDEARKNGGGGSGKGKGGVAGKGDVRHEVRTKLGAEWKALSEEGKRPYLDRCSEGRRRAEEAVAAYVVAVQEWDEKAAKVRAEFVDEGEEPQAMKTETEVAAAD